MATKKTRKMSKRAAKAVPAKAASRRGRDGGVNKSAFIREQPATMSAKEVVAAAMEQGITLTEGFVYNVRSNAKTKGTGAPKAAKPGPKPAVPKRRAAVVPATSEEATFRQLVVAMGTSRARELVAEVEDKLVAVIAGE